MESITSVKGFKDILPAEAEKWQYIESVARDIFRNFGIREIRIPLLEKTDLFKRGIGESTDIVEKEMYTFIDRGHEQLSLRPEATASVIRAYLEHTMYMSESVSKLFTIGPMFRRERPQKGRFRQFHQINVEVIGAGEPFVDAELILMLMHFLQSLDLRDLKLEINSLGCPVCRPVFRQKIVSYLTGKEGQLCQDCVRRLQSNPLRIYDCKVEGCRKVIASAPVMLDDVCPDCRDHFEKVLAFLGIFEAPFQINPHMVRGLDYYTRTAFEVTTESLGAQNAVAGGGRYDGLVRLLGGPDLPGIGFAVGLERLAALVPLKEAEVTSRPQIFIAVLGEVARVWSFTLCNYFRMLGIRAETGSSDKSLKSQMKQSDRLGSLYTLILGDKEIQEKSAELRDMESGIQETVSLDNFDSLAELIMNKTEER
ncbi:MAG: histidine--tRNA ligase [Syntrophales bacterium]